MNSQYKLLSELLSDQAAFITSPKTSLAKYWGALPPCPPSVYGPGVLLMYFKIKRLLISTIAWLNIFSYISYTSYSYI